jgi:hypothetical protein
MCTAVCADSTVNVHGTFLLCSFLLKVLTVLSWQALTELSVYWGIVLQLVQQQATVLLEHPAQLWSASFLLFSWYLEQNRPRYEADLPPPTSCKTYLYLYHIFTIWLA